MEGQRKETEGFPEVEMEVLSGVTGLDFRKLSSMMAIYADPLQLRHNSIARRNGREMEATFSWKLDFRTRAHS